MSNQWLKEQTRYVCIGVTLLCVMALKKEVQGCDLKKIEGSPVP